MLPLDRTKRAVQPYGLALATQRIPSSVSFRPYTGLAGVQRSGLAGLIDDLVNAGGNWLENRLQSSGISGTDPVAIQNEVAATMDQISAMYYPLRDSGQVTVAVITSYQQAFQNLINSFCQRMQQIGSSRALAGCSTIQYWGAKWIADREAEKLRVSTGGNPSTVPSSVINPVTGQPINFTTAPPPSGLASFGQYLPWLMAGVFIYAMVKTSHRW